MTTTRTITVRDHEVFVRTVTVPDEVPAATTFTAVTGGHRTAAWTAAAALLVGAVAFMPSIVALFH